VPRIDGRRNDQIRPTSITTGYQAFAEGSVLIEMGQTKVICAASIEERVPGWLRGQGKGWVTAEYSMLPRSTLSRTPRESTTGSVKGRYAEIQRLIGRSLRAVTDLKALGERTVNIDCDVLQADGGTRTASVTGAYVCLYMALDGLVRKGVMKRVPMHSAVAAVSVGLIDGELLLDLCYEEDFRAGVDFNIAMTGQGDLVEVQATGEGGAFSRQTLQQAIALGETGIKELLAIQQQVLHSLKPQRAV
jgi:ribonuclease PH